MTSISTHSGVAPIASGPGNGASKEEVEEEIEKKQRKRAEKTRAPTGAARLHLVLLLVDPGE